MWGCFVPSHDPITASKNIENIPYICLGSFSNLEGWQIPVDERSIILGILYPILNYGDPIYPLWDCVTLGVVDGFWTKWDFDPSFDVLQYPSLTNIRVIHRCMLPYWPYLCLNMVLLVKTLACYYYYSILERYLVHVLEFFLDPIQNLEWTMYTLVQYFLVQHFVICVAQGL